MFVALAVRDRRLAGAAAAGGAGDRRRHRPGQLDRAELDRRRLPGHGGRLLGRDLRADLPGRLDRPARAAGPADPALRAPADDVRRVLLAQARGRADLAHVERRRGARHARLGRDRHALRLVADADRDRGDPVHARSRAGADHLHGVPDPGRRLARVPDRQRRRLQGDAREGRRDHRLPAGDALRHPGRALVRAGAAASGAASRSSTRRTAPRT